MEEVPNIESESEDINKFNPIQIPIELNKIKYILKVNSIKSVFAFELIDIEKMPYINYKRKMDFKEIKEMNQLFNLLKTNNDFYDYLKLLSKNKKINIRKSKDKISIILFIDVLSKQQEIIIDLFPEENQLEANRKEKEFNNINNTNICFNYILNVIFLIIISCFILYIINSKFIKKYIESKENTNEILIKKIEKQIKELKDKNEKQIKELNKKIETQKKEINNLQILLIYLDKFGLRFSFFNQSAIIKGDEKNFIFREIENKMNKKIKEIKKLYQATKDGGDPKIFHLKCDNIPNTLVLIKSEDNKRFGGFTPIPWSSNNSGKKDNKNMTFVFSLDNKKIYFLKKMNSIAVFHNEKFGPYFGEYEDMAILGNPIKDKCLKIKGDYYNIPLNKSQSPMKALEYEVFRTEFY